MKKLILSTITLLVATFSQTFVETCVSCQNSQIIGQSTNAYSMLRVEQNQVFVNPALDIVGFVYRHNIATYGQTAADNGRLRYSISTDAGITWNTELGVLNNTYTRRARYPNAFLYNPIGNTFDTAAYIVWAGPTLSPNFDGHVNGTCQVKTSNPITTSENYQFQGTSTLQPGGLTESTSGVFWMVESATTADTVLIDSINVYKGTFSAGTVNWIKLTGLYAPHSTTFDGAIHTSSPNIAFSNDGQTGYIVFLGDIGACDSIYNPIIYKSTDAGSSWSLPYELHVDSVLGIGDSIKQYLFNGIESASEVAPAFECDITVDVNDNLHIFTTLCAVERRDTNGVIIVGGEKQYSVYSGYPKNAVDIYTTDGGISYTSLYVAQVNEFRTTLGGVSIDNFSQISRTIDGTIMFYSWSDTDTLVHPVPTNNEFPNTFIAGFNITNGKRTCWKQITGVTNEDVVFTPSMAPYVLEGLNGGPEYTLPIVTQESPGLDPLTFSVYHYFGKGAKFCDEDFMDPLSVDLSWSFASQCYAYLSCFSAGFENEQTINFQIYPNPAADNINIQIEQGENIRNITIINSTGQVVKTINPNLITGTVFNIDVTGLAAGMYTINMSTTAKTYSKKFTVVK